MADFRGFALSHDLLEVVAELGFQNPTPIQAEAIPLLLAGKDVIGQSRTGSGKTVAFGLPMLQRLDFSTRALRGLVLCPTRELSAQVARELRKLGRRHRGLQVLVLAGGEPLRAQAAALERGAHLAVGTPGRVIDHLRRRTLDLARVEVLVLDEADRMLDMGFADDMEEILRAAPKPRQTAFFSATFPRSIAAMSAAHQDHPARVTIPEPAERSPIRQVLVTVEPDQKLAALVRVLAAHPHEAALVFCNFKASVADVTRALAAAGIDARALHGDLEQYERDQMLARFRNGSTRVLVATDVAGRGLDVEDLELVVNYDVPPQPEVYIHRIGRTGRAGKGGLAVSIAGPREQKKLDAIQAATGVPLQRLVLDDAAATAPAPREAKMDTIQISGGRKDKVRPGDIQGALTGEAGGLDAADIGKIEIHDHFSYVAVARHVSAAAVRSLCEGRIKGRRFRARLVT